VEDLVRALETRGGVFRWQRPYLRSVSSSRRFALTSSLSVSSCASCPIGELDMATVGLVAEELTDLRDVGFESLVLDLRRLQFMDSSGVHLILDADGYARTNGHDFAVIPGPPVIQRLFELSGVGDQLQFRDP
jgi:anti-anti-sigma factor